MTTRPLPPTPYRGPIISAHRPLPAPPVPSPPSYTPIAAPSPVLKRRPHTRRLQSAPSADLPPVSEEEEAEIAEQEDEQCEPVFKPRRRPRPSPLIPSRSYGAPALPLVLEIPDVPVTFQDQPAADERESFSLSPSTLFARRRSETILDFPLPPSLSPPHSLASPSTPPPHHSPTPSHRSLASNSTASSSPYPLTPHPSDDDDDDDVHAPSEKEEVFQATLDEYENGLNGRSPRAPRRSASVLSLRSFSTAEFDAQAEPIYALMHPRRAPQPPRQPSLQVQVPEQSGGRSPRLVLSVLDTASGGSFNVPLVLGSFLSPPSSPCSPTADNESDGEGIPVWPESEDEDVALEPALSSSEDDTSDSEGPRRFLDPTFRTAPRRRRVSRNGNGNPQIPPFALFDPLEMGPDTPSEYSMASPAEWDRERTPPRESLVPSDILQRPPSPCETSQCSSTPSYLSQRPSTPSSISQRPPSPFHPALRSRFSTSTLASLPEPPTSSSAKHAFFARLTGRTKPSPPPASPRTERAPFSPRERASFGRTRTSTSMRRRTHVPASPAPSAFSFSTHSSASRSSLDSSETRSVMSEDSSGSTGLRRPPIPIELFLRG